MPWRKAKQRACHRPALCQHGWVREIETKFNKPRCFKNVAYLPLSYRANRKLWMVSDLLNQWVCHLDKKFTRQKRKVLLFVDNCAAHPKVPHLKYITLQFLPPNTTSQLQPMDQGVIRNMKVHYRRKLPQTLLSAYDAGETPQPVNILETINMVHTAWGAFEQDCIANCFRKAGFIDTTPRSPPPHQDQDQAQDQDQDQDQDQHGRPDNIWERLTQHINLPVTFQDYASVDMDLQVTDEPSEEEIVAEITSERASNDGNDFEEAEAMEAARAQTQQLTVRQCISMMTQVQHFICTWSNMTDGIYISAANIMNYLSEEQHGATIQGKITDL
ncbi:tigger transposable element-derived protein 6-like [Acanthaster planci]|uniref:Tigger transposable element-derived protein 6-like n=1 Tax=Acanthaster planci TaxID=133434 RepID=A0A8B7ZT19_ACAPL|nr:tigger transposable element-derived protein 6-like [Acanthaster planci]